jgi:hypothetical protein
MLVSFKVLTIVAIEFGLLFLLLYSALPLVRLINRLRSDECTNTEED